ncbi:hypothetical protein PFISCL1PPCAC_22449 [Pristionchus fissidentatus]|uniref:Uncharacterized protein n=1 Tax=Pristionchus fissidentatus TaxID=1538716 RepID=A0AAV5WMX6_9BILA|nr:hypothetical protein PFISCL1PPCAC_22449 [Pristionchus fissidentatus]
MRRRATSASSAAGLSELSILTHAWIPHSCSPSPTRMSDSTKQCYSPSTQKIVRANIPYSPSPSPTASPTRKRLMTARSQSPIASRSALKRRVDGLPSSPVSLTPSAPFPSMMGGILGSGGVLQLQVSKDSAVETFVCVAASGSSSNGNGSGCSSSNGSPIAPPPEKRACPAGALSGYVRNSTSPLVIMDARAASAAAAAAVRRSSLFLVDPEIRRARYGSYIIIVLMDSYSEVGDSRDGGDSISEPSSVLMPTGDDAYDPDALLFRAPSVPPPLSVGSNCSSYYEAAAAEADDTKSTVDGEEEKMEEEDLNTSSSSLSLLEPPKEELLEGAGTPSECAELDDVSQKEETAIAAMEE